MNSKKKMALKIILAAGIAGIIGLAAVFILKITGRSYLSNTKVNGYEVGGKSVDSVASMLERDFNKTRFILTEEGETSLDVTLPELGYSLDMEALKFELNSLIDNKNSNPLKAMQDAKVFTVDYPVNLNSDTYQAVLSASNLLIPREESVDAALINTDDGVVLQPEYYGNTFIDGHIQEYADSIIRSSMSDNIGKSITLEMPDSIYIKPELTTESPELTEQMDIYNSYAQTVITYQFGSQTQVLDWNTMKSWVVAEDNKIVILSDGPTEYAYSLAYDYDTIYSTREFVTSGGETITLPYNDYGYMVNQGAEAAQIVADIQGGAPVSREPVYSNSGYRREGRDDLAGYYVEVDISEQHLWFYWGGEVAVECDVVTGTAGKNDTHQGAYPLAYKVSPYNLTGGGGDGVASWDVEVTYWMPFTDGQGLHDASWRGSFGGSIYRSSGSHGCVNMPSWAAGEVYSLIEAGVAIIVHE